MEKDLTTGSIGKTILRFSLPFLLSFFLQTLYGMADLFIIGQFNKVDSTTAVSIGSQVMHMITVMIVGLAMGTTVIIGQGVGAKEKKTVSGSIGNTVILFSVVACAATILLLIFVKRIVTVMSTPKAAFSGTVAYLTICFIGIPFITAYNVISSIFRGMGDSKSPMYFVAVACVLNIGLDYLFIGALGLGAAGAALGTTIAQTASVLISLFYIRKKQLLPKISGADFKPDRKILGKILKVGVPICVQDGFIQISFIVITVFANMRGLQDAAAVGIVEKLIGILFLIPSTMLSTVSALAAQNMGAGKHRRAVKTLEYAVLITICFGMAASIVMQFAAGWAISLFTDDKAVIVLGDQYMRSYVWDCIFAGIHFCFSGYFCAYGYSNISFLHNLASILCARIPIAYVASVHFTDTLFPMGLAAPIGSVLSVLICLIAFARLKRCFGIREAE